MQEGNVLRRENRYAKVYSTKFGWSRAHPTKRKADAHETLYVFIKRDGVPPKIVIYGSKEQYLGSFSRKCQEEGFHIKQTNTYSQWKLQTEENIREPKKGAGRKMVWTGAPKRLCDDVLQFESYVRSNTALDIYMMHGGITRDCNPAIHSRMADIRKMEKWVNIMAISQGYEGVSFSRDRGVCHGSD